MTQWLRRSLLLSPFFLFLISAANSSAQGQRPAERYQALMGRSVLEARVRVFVSDCLRTQHLRKPVGLYQQGDWFVTPDLARQVAEEGMNDDGTAQVWELDGLPRAVSLWVHDDEFDRNTLACLDRAGVVERQVNEYMPGLSEPNLHWISIHTFVREPDGRYRESSRYTDWDRHPIAAPRLTSEDRDFIAGERRYDRWSEFDFADALARSGRQ